VKSLATIEIKPRANGSLPVDLIRDAYRASRRGRIVLLLDGVEPARIDEIVDPLVRSMRRTIPGLRYVDTNDRASAISAMQESCCTFLSQGGEFGGFGTGMIEVTALEQAPQMLDRMNRPTRLAEINAAQTCADQALSVGKTRI